MGKRCLISSSHVQKTDGGENRNGDSYLFGSSSEGVVDPGFSLVDEGHLLDDDWGSRVEISIIFINILTPVLIGTWLRVVDSARDTDGGIVRLIINCVHASAASTTDLLGSLAAPVQAIVSVGDFAVAAIIIWHLDVQEVVNILGAEVSVPPNIGVSIVLWGVAVSEVVVDDAVVIVVII